jgi:hypothetical protein
MPDVNSIIQKISGWIDEIFVSGKPYTKYLVGILALAVLSKLLKVRINLGSSSTAR